MELHQEIILYGVPVPEFYVGYASHVKDINFTDLLSQQLQTTPAFFDRIKPASWDYSYAPGKWTVKEVVLHMIDAERIFAYRALRFSRNDATELPGFEENDYVPMSNARNRTPLSLIAEYKSVRNATIELFKNLTDEMLLRKGFANGRLFSAGLIGVCIAGHEIHHLHILRDRYKL